MPSRHVQFLAGEYYHIFNRGVDRQPIYFGSENYRYFLSLLAAKSKRFSIEVVAYCLMPNHFHFLLKPSIDNNISAFMNSLLGSYVQALNRQRNRVGPLLQGRFRSMRVDREEYLVHLARYIHRNPVEAGFVIAPEHWPHSDYAGIVALGPAALTNDSLVPDRFQTPEAYRRFVHELDVSAPEGFSAYLLDR